MISFLTSKDLDNAVKAVDLGSISIIATFSARRDKRWDIEIQKCVTPTPELLPITAITKGRRYVDTAA
ncbi:hypothetical protein D3C81_1733590 [compost metagenome]